MQIIWRTKQISTFSGWQPKLNMWKCRHEVHFIFFLLFVCLFVWFAEALQSKVKFIYAAPSSVGTGHLTVLCGRGKTYWLFKQVLTKGKDYPMTTLLGWPSWSTSRKIHSHWKLVQYVRVTHVLWCDFPAPCAELCSIAFICELILVTALKLWCFVHADIVSLKQF